MKKNSSPAFEKKIQIVTEQAFLSLLNKILLLGVILGGIGTVLSFIRFKQSYFKIYCIFDAVLYIVLILLLILRKKLPIFLSEIIISITLLFIGFTKMLSLGLATMSFIMYTAAAILAVLFFDLFSGFLIILISVILSVIAGLGILTLKIIPQIDYNIYLKQPTTWAIQIVSVFTYSVVLIFAIKSLKDEYISAIKKNLFLLPDDMPDCLFIHSLIDRKIEYVSPSVYTMTGYTPEELIGHDIKEFFSPEQRERLIENFKEYVKKAYDGEDIKLPTLEIDYIKKDGSILTGEMRPVFLYDKKNKPYACMGIIRDITERKKEEKRKKELEEHIRRLENIQTIGKFSSAIVHDINNYLFSIAILTESIIERSKEPEITEEAKKILSTLQKSSEYIKNLLNFAKDEKNRIFLPVNIVELLKDIISMLEKRFEKKVLFFLRYQPEIKDLVILSESSLLHHSLFNISLNAAQAVEEKQDGKVEIEVSLIEGEKIPQEAIGNFERKGKFLLIEIKDNGKGMSEDVLNKIFEPFFTTKSLSNNSGLGLALTWNIINILHGTIVVKSKKEEGSIFSIYIPARTA